MPPNSKPILVTGASGFLAMHTIIQLLEQGHLVRGTLRDPARESEVRRVIGAHTAAADRLTLLQADLLEEAGWQAAVQGCEYGLHIASPFPLFAPHREQDLILPAVEGTQRVLRAAHQARLQRIVIVSSNAAISAGHHGENRTFTGQDWSIIENDIGAYAKSKTLAEREAWSFINGRQNVNGLEMVAINPPLILGPILNRDLPTSAEVIRVFMCGEVPGVGRLKMGLVDVRDVASALILAMTAPEAAGERLPCPAATMWIGDIAAVLRRKYGGQGYRIPRLQFPSFMIRLLALFDKKIALVTRDLDWDYELSNEKIKQVLHWSPRSNEEAILSMAESLIAQGFVP